MSLNRALLFSLALALPAMSATTATAQSIEGEWLVQDKDGRVRIAPCGGDASKLCGSIVWMAAPSDATGPKRDLKNQNVALRTRTIMGMPLITGFSPNGAGKWSGGKIYNPKDGKTYNSKLELTKAGALKVSGCVSVICQTQMWTRAN